MTGDFDPDAFVAKLQGAPSTDSSGFDPDAFVQKLQGQGQSPSGQFDPDKFVAKLQGKPQQTEAPSAVQTGLQEAAREALPTAAGISADLWAGSLLAAPETGGASLLIPIIGGLVFAMGASWSAGKLQEMGAKQVLGDEKFKKLEEQFAAGEKAHPIAALAGGIVPQAIAFRPSIKNIDDAAGVVKALKLLTADELKTYARTPQGASQIHNAINVAVGSGTQAGMEIYNQIQEGEFHPVRFLANVLAGAVLTGRGAADKGEAMEPPKAPETKPTEAPKITVPGMEPSPAEKAAETISPTPSPETKGTLKEEQKIMSDRPEGYYGRTWDSGFSRAKNGEKKPSLYYGTNQTSAIFKSGWDSYEKIKALQEKPKETSKIETPKELTDRKAELESKINKTGELTADEENELADINDKIEEVSKPKIESAVAVDPATGKVTEGADHVEAAEKQGLPVSDDAYVRENDPRLGFKTDEGNLVSRDEAKPIAEEAGQTEGKVEGKIHSSDIDIPEKSPMEKLEEGLAKGTAEPKEVAKTVHQQMTDAVNEAKKTGKNVLAQSLDGFKAVWDSLLRLEKRLAGKPMWTSLKKLIGENQLSAADRTAETRKMVETAKTWRRSDKFWEAASPYVDAGGDEGVIREAIGQFEQQAKNSTGTEKLRLEGHIQQYKDALAMSAEDKKLLMDEVVPFHEGMKQSLIKEGMFEEGVMNYLHRIIKEPMFRDITDNELKTKFPTKDPTFTKHRTYSYDHQAIMAGYDVEKNALKRIAMYNESANKALADRRMVNGMKTINSSDGKAMIGDANSTTADGRSYVYFDNPTFKKLGAYVHPDDLPQIKALFEPSWLAKNKYFKTAMKVGSVVKQTMFDLSGFHFVQTGIHALEHMVNPLGLSKLDLKNPVHRALISHGLVADMGSARQLFSEGVSSASLSKYVPVFGKYFEKINQTLFDTWIPRLKITMGEEALQRNIRRYGSEEMLKQLFPDSYAKMTESGKKFKGDSSLDLDKVLHLTANESNAAFGGLNWKLMGINDTTRDVMRMTMLAPDFLIARGQFVKQAALPYGKEQLRALMTGAAVMYVAARVLNQAVNGRPHFEPENAFSLVLNGEAYSMRTVQGDLMHLINDPGKFAYSRLNPVYGRTVMEGMTGRDVFGRKRDAMEQTQDLLSTVVPISLRGILPGNKNEQTLAQALLNAFGFTTRKYNQVNSIYKQVDEWKKANHVLTKGEFIYDPDNDPYRNIKVALSKKDEAGAAHALLDAMQKYQITLAKAKDHFQRYAHTPFTGSAVLEKKFKASLGADSLGTYNEALQEKKDMNKEFIKTLALLRSQNVQFPKAKTIGDQIKEAEKAEKIATPAPKEEESQEPAEETLDDLINSMTQRR